jgi:pimeloyl-ACP methyl ester carboxylesterase
MDWRDAERVRQGLSRPATLSLVENAGHHLYLENGEVRSAMLRLLTLLC